MCKRDERELPARFPQTRETKSFILFLKEHKKRGIGEQRDGISPSSNRKKDGSIP